MISSTFLLFSLQAKFFNIFTIPSNEKKELTQLLFLKLHDFLVDIQNNKKKENGKLDWYFIDDEKKVIFVKANELLIL